MAERLTTRFHGILVKEADVFKIQVITKLGQLEDIMEKYDIENVEELDETLDINNYANEIVIMLRNRCQKLVDECNIWKKACELACEEIDCEYMYGINKENYSQYFYQQAKTEL